MNDTTVYEISVKFVELAGIWCKVDMTQEAMLDTLKTGLFKNKQVEAIVVDSFAGSDSCIVYNIVAAKSGGQPWTTMSQSS